MTGYNASDMETKAADHIVDANKMVGAAAQEAVAWQVGDDFYTSESLAIEGIQQWGPSGSIAIPLYAAPVAAAPVVDPSRLGAAMKAFDDAGGHAVSYAPAWMRKALEAASTPAAPRIDPRTPRNREEAMALAKLALAYLGVVDAHIDAAILRCETDASPNGGSDDAWRSMDAAPKSVADGNRVEGVYLLGFIPDDDLVDPQACIDVIWWEPLLPNSKGGRGKWCANRYSEACEVAPTKWQHLPNVQATSAEVGS